MTEKDSLSVCLSVSEESWIVYFWNYSNWLDEPLEIFISDESLKEQRIHAKKAISWLVFAHVF